MKNKLFLVASGILAVIVGLSVSSHKAEAALYGCNFGYTKHASLVSGNTSPTDCLTNVCHKINQHTAGHSTSNLPLPPPFNTPVTATWDYVMVGDIVANLPSCPAFINNGTFQ